ncbi:unnamed protein product [Brassicogethes aeneus]|uniref:HAT C-terminal dimerisation domain-containing protein n=1 Tax=Brassicogethes aeneus TaxID=1431903 RepID=A0A9P0FKC3_BRAAE|nr:unnamed protein product [Brassicogethes aeneus]
MSDSDKDSESSANLTPPRKLPKKGGWTRKKEGNTSSHHRQQNFRQQWLKDPAFKDWLLPDTKDVTKAKCVYCPGSSMVAEISNLKVHASTKKHIGNKPGTSGKTQTLTSFGFQKGVVPPNKEKARAEIKLAAFFAEHNIAFSAANHLTDLLKEIVTDSKLIKEIQLKRTKVTAVVKNVLGEGHKADLAAKLQKTLFSVMTDETTDVSSVKTSCIVVRYFDQEAQKICSTFWELYNVFKETVDTEDIPTANAENLYRALISSLSSRNIPLTNVIGFGSDGCNVMMGDIDSVKTRLIRDFPGIIIVKCVCHSAHLCTSEACKQLPEGVEQLARDIYNFFRYSDKRQFDFRNFQSFAAVEPHKILKPSQTRWLSLLAVVERIVEQWEALRLFFIDFTTNREHRAKADVRNRAVAILEKLSNQFYKLYFSFLVWSLPIFNKFNLEFQSEKVVVHNLHVKIRELYTEILLRYLKREYVMRSNLEEIDPKIQDCQLPDKELYFGEPDQFWVHLLKTEDFSDLAYFALSTLSLPHANADCERVFSKVNLLKTKLRNKLIVETVNGTLLAAEATKGPKRDGNCINFEPTKEMYSRMTKDNLYDLKKKDDVSEDVPDILFRDIDFE